MADKKNSSSLASGVAGAVIGAAAAAAAIALSDEKNRGRAEKVLKDMQKEGKKIFKEISKMALELKDKSEKVISDNKGAKKTKKVVSKSKKKS